MADKTGYSQAAVVYRVRASDGAPVGLDGKPISETGNKQAIAILAGRTNPDPSKYVVQMFYAPEAILEGVPTVQLSDDCATGYIFLSEARVVFFAGGAAQLVNVTSSDPWDILSDAGLVTVTPNTGPQDVTQVSVAPIADTYGEGDVIFRNITTGQTVRLHVISAEDDVWILEDGTWNALGFWHGDGIWNTI